LQLFDIGFKDTYTKIDLLFILQAHILAHKLSTLEAAYASVRFMDLPSFLLVFSVSIFWNELSKVIPLMYGDCFRCEMILEMVRLGLDLLLLMALSSKE
jgi:hypothetical protein